MSSEKKVSGLRALYKRFTAERRRRFFRWSLKRSDGDLLLLDRTSALDRRIMQTGTWEAKQVAYLQGLAKQHRAVRQKAMFLDVGSYFGLYSLRMLRTGLFDRICAFEANPVNFAHLQTSLLLNDCVADIEAFNLAVSSKAGYIHVPRPNERDRGASSVLMSVDEPGVFEIRGITLDEHFTQIRDQLIVIKIDVEGHEEHALEGMQNLVAHNSVILQIEIFRENEANVLPILERLKLTKIDGIYPDSWFVKL